MKLTNTQVIHSSLEEIFSLPDNCLIDREDFDNLFPETEEVQGIRVAGKSVEEVSTRLKEELPQGFNPKNLLVYYIGEDLRMQDLADLDKAIGHSQRYKRGIVVAQLPYGRITVYLFYA